METAEIFPLPAESALQARQVPAKTLSFFMPVSFSTCGEDASCLMRSHINGSFTESAKGDASSSAESAGCDPRKNKSIFHLLEY